jgi:hypothetical protein
MLDLLLGAERLEPVWASRVSLPWQNRHVVSERVAARLDFHEARCREATGFGRPRPVGGECLSMPIDMSAEAIACRIRELARLSREAMIGGSLSGGQEREGCLLRRATVLSDCHLRRDCSDCSSLHTRSSR